MAETDWDGGEKLLRDDYVMANIGNQLYGYDLIRKAPKIDYIEDGHQYMTETYLKSLTLLFLEKFHFIYGLLKRRFNYTANSHRYTVFCKLGNWRERWLFS